MEWLAACADEIGHPDPRAAARFGLRALVATALDRVVFTESSGPAFEPGDDDVERQLEALLLSYLRHGV